MRVCMEMFRIYIYICFNKYTIISLTIDAGIQDQHVGLGNMYTGTLHLG